MGSKSGKASYCTNCKLFDCGCSGALELGYTGCASKRTWTSRGEVVRIKRTGQLGIIQEYLWAREIFFILLLDKMYSTYAFIDEIEEVNTRRENNVE